MDTAKEIRPFQARDRPAVLSLWHQGWHDAHAHLVPLAVLSYRTPHYFSLWIDECQDEFFVFQEGSEISGFVFLQVSELVKLYVSRKARGKGAAAILLKFAESTLVERNIGVASLFCTTGNRRAEAFYTRHGWVLSREFEDVLWLPKAITAGRPLASTQHFTKMLIP